jgi:hypothetical protein
MPHPRHAAAHPSGYPEDPELERAAADPAVAAAMQVGVVDAVRDAGGYLAASCRLIPGSEGRAGKFNWEY